MKQLEEGLAVLVLLLVVADLSDLISGEPLYLLLYFLDAQVVVVFKRRG
jgi:hypothetical protein